MYRKEMFLFGIAYTMVMLFSLYFADQILKNSQLALFFFVIFLIPLFLLRYVKKFFIRQGSLTTKIDGFLIEIQNRKKTNAVNIPFRSIQNYTILFPTREFYVIEFIVNGNRKIEFSFVDFNKEENNISSSEIISLFNKSIKDYNNGFGAKKIVYKPSFIASKKGFATLTAMVVLLLLAIFLHIITKQYHTMPVSIICGFLLWMQTSSQRKADLRYYKKHIEDGQ